MILRAVSWAGEHPWEACGLFWAACALAVLLHR